MDFTIVWSFVNLDSGVSEKNIFTNVVQVNAEGFSLNEVSASAQQFKDGL